jgi:uncharacterized protein (DUF885 family)
MQTTSDQQLDDLIRDEWEFRMIENPTFATFCGDHRYNDRLPGMNEADYARRAESVRAFLTRLEWVKREPLSPAAQLNCDIFERELRVQLGELEFGLFYIPITKSTGLPGFFPDVLNLTPFKTASNFEGYILRLRAFKRLAEETVQLMRSGVRKGYLPPRAAMAGVLEGFRQHAECGVEASAFYVPFQALPASLPSHLAEEGRAAILESVQLGYRLLADYLENEYLPLTSQDAATLQMPEAAAFYRFCVRRYTSLNLSPEEVHVVGLEEVARIRAEMEAVARLTGFTGSLHAFADSLRGDARFFVDTPLRLMQEVAYLLKQVEGKLPSLFKTLPRTPLGLRQTPDYVAPTSTSAYYFPPAGDGSTAGFYYVNTYDLPSRPLYEYESLTMHEAVPGHHLQLALQIEMGEAPNFRKFSESTAFVEGWALYAERLGLEMGFYSDYYTNYGRLTYEMWRVARLVVDTGLHYFGWTRRQAIDYLTENTALSLLNITNEVDRYISWPGQALAYKIGELKMRELRRRAEEQLGSRFDVREFHDVVLRSGGIPLDVLDAQVEAWITALKV